MTDKTEWCPTRGGVTRGYLPEFWDMDKDRWENIPLVHGVHGAPYPLLCGGVLREVDMLGYEQAQCIAWLYSAQSAAIGDHIMVRVQEYELHYDIKARKILEAEKPPPAKE